MIAAAARTLVTKLGEATPRERAALAVLAAIGALTGVIYGFDWAAARAAAASAAAQTAADRGAQLSVFENADYRARLSAESDQVRRWSRVTGSLAAEEIVAELEGLCAQAGFGDAEVLVTEQGQGVGQVANLMVSISTAFDWGAFLALLEAFDGSGLSLIVRSVDVTESEVGQRLTLTIAVPVIMEDEPR